MNRLGKLIDCGTEIADTLFGSCGVRMSGACNEKAREKRGFIGVAEKRNL